MKHRLLDRKVSLPLAMTLLAGGMAWSIHTLSPQLTTLHIGLLAGTLLATVPLTLGLATLRFRLTSWLGGDALPLVQCLRVVILGAAANFLPIPGALLVRIHALRHQGLRTGTLANLTATVVWLCVSSSFAAIACARLQIHLAVEIFLAIAAIGFAASVIACLHTGFRLVRLVPLFMVQAAISGIDIARLWAVSMALSNPIDLATAAIVGFSGVVGTMSGILPAGLGLTESVAAALAALSALNPAFGFLIAGVNRLLLWAGILPAALLLIMRQRSEGASRNGDRA